jgi:acyl dehydratase
MSEALMDIADFTMANVPRFVGREMGTSGWIEVGQDRIDNFAACTGDEQWIHVDVERAQRESPFGATIAHGYLTLSLIAPMVAEVGLVPSDAKAALNYGLDKVRFMTPVRAGARVRDRIVLLGVEDKPAGRKLIRLQNTIEIDGEPRPALVAESLVLLIAAGG